MPSFRSNSKYVHREPIIIFTIHILLLAILYYILSHFDFINITTVLSFIFPAFLSVNKFIRRTKQILVEEIDINHSNRLISFYCYNFWKGHTTRIESLDKIKIDIEPGYSEGLFSGKTLAIFFYLKVPSDFYITKEKDNFSKDDLLQIAEQFKKV